MRVLSNDDIDKLLTMPECIDALEEMYLDHANNQALLVPRVDNISPATEPGAYYAFKQMGGAWPRHGVQALRINSDIITHPIVAGKMRREKKPKANGRWVGLVFMFSSETGALVGIFPDGVMQRMRVGAASGIAFKHMARKDSKTLTIIGSGWQAGGQLMAALALQPFQQVRIFSPRAERRAAFVEESRLRHPGVEFINVDNAEEAVYGTDVVMASTSSLSRVLEPAWIKPGMHVSCIKPTEIDPAIVKLCDQVVVHVAKEAKLADNIMPNTPNVNSGDEAGWWTAQGSELGQYTDLAQLVSGKASGRKNSEDVTCFINNVGIGLQFAAAGALVLKKARTMDIGHELPDDWFSEDVHP